MEISFSLHPVVAWAWIVAGGIVGGSLVVGVWAALRGDEIYGWQESCLYLLSKLSMLVILVAIVLTITSFVFLGVSGGS